MKFVGSEHLQSLDPHRDHEPPEAREGAVPPAPIFSGKSGPGWNPARPQFVGRATAAAPAVGARAARGAFWTLVFSASSKVVAVGSQIALAWLLLPQDFGLVATALSVASLASILSGSGLKNVLIQRADHFAEEAAPAFWLALALNSASALLLVAFAPLAGLVFGEPRLIALVWVTALAAPLQALPIVYSACLYRDLRFRHVALIHFGAGIVQNATAVLLAGLGFGPFALMLPVVGMAVYLAIAFRWAAGRLPLGRPEPRRWKPLGAPVCWLMAHGLFASLQTYGGNFVIGLHHGSQITGFFYWGYCVSYQAIFLLSTNLQLVLMPALSTLNAEPSRQFEAVVKAAQALVAVVAPVCALQLLLAPALIDLIFHERWLPSIQVVQWLSIGMLSQPLNLLAVSVLMARGKYPALVGAGALSALLLVGAAALGSQLGEQQEIAACVAVGLMAGNLFAGRMLLREFGKGWSELLRSIGPPLAMAAAALVLGVGVRSWASRLSEPGLALVTAVAYTGSYLLLLGWFQPRLVQEVCARLSSRFWSPIGAKTGPASLSGL